MEKKKSKIIWKKHLQLIFLMLNTDWYSSIKRLDDSSINNENFIQIIIAIYFKSGLVVHNHWRSLTRTLITAPTSILTFYQFLVGNKEKISCALIQSCSYNRQLFKQRTSLTLRSIPNINVIFQFAGTWNECIGIS